MGLREKALALYQQYQPDTSTDFALRPDKNSAPAREILRLTHRHETLLNLMEAFRELVQVKTEDEFWSTIVYSLLGQTGAREVAIFFKEDSQILLKASRGFILEQDFRMPAHSDIFHFLQGSKKLHTSEELQANLAEKEKNWLNSLKVSLLVPVLHYEELAGFIFIGHPVGVEHSQYPDEDKIYLGLFGEVLGSYFEIVKKTIAINQQKQNWQRREKARESFDQFLTSLEKSTDTDHGRNLLQKYLADSGLEAYIFLLRQGNQFFPYCSQGLHKETLNQFAISVYEPWVEESRTFNGWSQYRNFFTDDHLQQRLSVEYISGNFARDRQNAAGMHLLPFFMRGHFSGLFLLFKSKNLLGEELQHIRTALDNFFWFKYSQATQNDLSQADTLYLQALSDPLFALRTYYETLEKKLLTSQNGYACIQIKMTNLVRLQNLFGAQTVVAIKDLVLAFLKKQQKDNDFLAEILPAHFFMIFHGLNRQACHRLLDDLQKLLQEQYLREETRPVYRSLAYCRPEDKYLPFDSVLLV